MAPRQNPLKLNSLQLRTLVLLQELSKATAFASPGPAQGEVTIERFPHPHGDHVHIGDGVVAAKDMTGLTNEKVWHALERKGLARADWPHRIILTALAASYETGLSSGIIHRTTH